MSSPDLSRIAPAPPAAAASAREAEDLIINRPSDKKVESVALWCFSCLHDWLFVRSSIDPPKVSFVESDERLLLSIGKVCAFALLYPLLFVPDVLRGIVLGAADCFSLISSSLSSSESLLAEDLDLIAMGGKSKEAFHLVMMGIHKQLDKVIEAARHLTGTDVELLHKEMELLRAVLVREGAAIYHPKQLLQMLEVVDHRVRGAFGGKRICLQERGGQVTFPMSEYILGGFHPIQAGGRLQGEWVDLDLWVQNCRSVEGIFTSELKAQFITRTVRGLTTYAAERLLNKIEQQKIQTALASLLQRLLISFVSGPRGDIQDTYKRDIPQAIKEQFIESDREMFKKYPVEALVQFILANAQLAVEQINRMLSTHGERRDPVVAITAWSQCIRDVFSGIQPENSPWISCFESKARKLLGFHQDFGCLIETHLETLEGNSQQMERDAALWKFAQALEQEGFIGSAAIFVANNASCGIEKPLSANEVARLHKQLHRAIRNQKRNLRIVDRANVLLRRGTGGDLDGRIEDLSEGSLVPFRFGPRLYRLINQNKKFYGELIGKMEALEQQLQEAYQEHRELLRERAKRQQQQAASLIPDSPLIPKSPG
jgi:hypothetical protein